MQDLYKKIYAKIGSLTPIKSDCGLLCDKACCAGDSDTGMYLYPGEELMFQGKPSFGEIKPTDFTYSYNGEEHPVLMLVCQGNCDRQMRPLACRIFPFVPYLDDEGNMDIEIDIRSEKICPLARNADEAAFDDAFLDNVAEAFGIAAENEKVLAFIKTQSELIDEFYDMI